MIMAVFDTSNARITVVANEAKPRSESVHVATKKVVAYHLSRGSNGTNRPVLFAFDFSGEVDLKSGTREELATFKFGFVQFGRQGIMQFVYQGRRPEEGHVVVDVGPLVGTSFLLDQHPSATQKPFYLDPSFNLTVVNGQQVVSTDMGDHPFLSIEDTVPNTKTGFDNFLFAVADSRQFVSIFTAQRPDGTFVHFAHLQWFLTYSEKYRWKGGVIASKEENSSFRTEPVQVGPPKSNRDVQLEGLLKQLGPSLGPTYNDKSLGALRQAMTPGNPNRFDNSGRFPLSPADFWQ
jgi:hypothetical protein